MSLMKSKLRWSGGTPFVRGGAEPFVYCGGSVDESLARISFLIERGSGLGWLTGDSGAGKSVLFRRVGWAVRRFVGGRPWTVACCSLAGMRVGQLASRLVAQCGLASQLSNLDPQDFEGPWRILEDLVTAAPPHGTPVVFLLDDIDRARFEVREELQRWVHLPGRWIGWLASGPSFFHEDTWQLADRCQLQVRLKPWSLIQTADYFDWAAASCGADENWFEGAAIERIHQIAAGNPRTIARLAEWSLSAAHQDHQETVRTEWVDRAAQEHLNGNVDAGSFRVA
ncbi:MAG: hypothetical protein ACK5ZC_02310 [Pirellulaceae bacterium]|jgi:hypothetical protein